MRSSLGSEFRPRRGLRNPHLQTIAARWARARAEPRTERTRLDTPDGDFIDVDVWSELREPRGACLLLHGLEGCARSRYMVTTASALLASGIQPVALNFRSCSGEPNRTPQSYHSGRTDDIAQTIAWVRDRYASLPVGAVGFSLGGNALINLLGREPDADRVAAAVAVSVPYDLSACAGALERGLGRLYGNYFLRTLRKKAEEKARRFPGRVDPRGATARSIRAFDDLLTAPIHGFEDADDYYARCSAGRHVGQVRTPTLLIQSSDDPLVPDATIPVETIRRSPALRLVLTSGGGHVGFLDEERGAGPAGWLEQTIARFVVDALTGADLSGSDVVSAQPTRGGFASTSDRTAMESPTR
ncbi:MAG: hydrolase [Gemmatimonadetes bacterium]|nr:hydrolase [Gemmatimonadota bacterium]